MIDPTEAYQPPRDWTWDHVMVRLILAFETLGRVAMREGPGGYASGWPDYVHDRGDQNMQLTAIENESDEERESRIRREAELSLRIKVPPTAREYSMMEEAIFWPFKYLGAQAVRSHIVRWSKARAHDGHYDKAPVTRVVAEAKALARGLRADRIVVR